MLAELAAANAAFAVIKQCVQNGRELTAAGNAIAQFVTAKEQLQRKGNRKRKKSGVGGSDLEEFMALEKIREQEEQLKQFMIYAGRPGLWNDWQRFQAEARKSRRVQEELAKRRREEIMEMVGYGVAALIVIAGIAGLVAWALWMTFQIWVQHGRLRASGTLIARKKWLSCSLPSWLLMRKFRRTRTSTLMTLT